MKHYEVCCAIIENSDGKLFCCKRGPGRANEDKWEFPGGKIEKDESKADCIIREISEELSTLVEPYVFIGKSDYTYTNLVGYEDFSITMYGFRCRIINGNLSLSEHIESRWCTIEEMKIMDFAEADKYFIRKL